MHVILSNHYTTTLCDLDFGSAFELFGEYYILANTRGRMPEVANSPVYCCVRITDGECVLFNSGEKVHPLTADVVIGEYK